MIKLYTEIKYKLGEMSLTKVEVLFFEVNLHLVICQLLLTSWSTQALDFDTNRQVKKIPSTYFSKHFKNVYCLF